MATALRVFSNCAAGAPASLSRFWEGKIRSFERSLRDTVMTARALDANRQAQQQAKIDQLREQAKRDRGAAEEQWLLRNSGSRLFVGRCSCVRLMISELRRTRRIT
jgi:hypothetical protein